MNNDNDRYMITAFDMDQGSDLIWSNCGKGLSKETALRIYQYHKQNKNLTNITISQILTVKETTIYTFDNE